MPVKFDLSSATIDDLQAAMEAGALTAERLVQLYLARIAAYDRSGPCLNSVLALNPRAADDARALDDERRVKGPRSPLHGIAVLAKDVFDTKDLPTTGGFKPMASSLPARDSFVIDRLRHCGAVILGKLNMTDWYAKTESRGSTLGGTPLSPYNAAKYPGGSSSGTGVAMAAWFGSVGLGSDTSGSILIPAAFNSLAAISATRGLVSRTGMMWSSPTQENGGPMCRSVRDCALVLDAIAGYDASDHATHASIGKLPPRPYASYAQGDARVLRGAALGVLREAMRAGAHRNEGRALAETAFAEFAAAGANLLDPAETGLPLADPDYVMAADTSPYERAVAIDHYLGRLPDSAPIRSVTEMVARAGETLIKPVILESMRIPSLDRHPPMLAALERRAELRAALVGLMDRSGLDALLLPYETARAPGVPVPFSLPDDNQRNALAPLTGLPTVLIPAGVFRSDGMPFSMQLIGRPFSEPRLIEIASAYEAATRHHRRPISTPPLSGECFEYESQQEKR